MPFDNHDIDASAPVGLASRRRVPAWVWALVVFVLGMALTLWLATGQKRIVDRDQHHVFTQETRQIVDGLQAQLSQCEYLLRAFQSIFLASNEVTPEEYARAYENMQLNSMLRVSLQALVYYERRHMQDGDHYIATMFAPKDGNETLRGLDVSSQPTNMQALTRSRDTNHVAMSAPFRLRQSGGGEEGRDGFILRLPVYGGGTTPDSLEARRQAITGSIGVSFRFRDLVESTLPRNPRRLADLTVEDVSDGTPQPLYFQSFGIPAVGPSHSMELRFGGRIWNITTHAGPKPVGRNEGQLVLLAGTLIAALLAALTWALVSTRERAITLGTSMSQRFRASEERFRRLNELLPSLVVLARRSDGIVVYRNAVARSKLAAESGLAELSPLLAPDNIARLFEENAGEVVAMDAQMRDSRGMLFWASTSINAIEIDGAPMWLLVASDISEQRQLTERLSYQASHDSLTRLFNRREFEARAQVLLERGERRDGALLFIDLDQFKLINDTSGHGAGDELLVQLAAIMRDRLRPGDVLGRLGGDEFGVLLAGVSGSEAALQAAERLRRCIESFIFSWEQRSYTISASIGVVRLASAGSLKELFAHADTACYLAKEAGRNRVHLYAEDDTAVTSRLGEMEWANRIRDALRDGRLLLDYQELHPLRLGQEQGAHIELLLRLRGEDGGEVPPGAFLPAAERYGLMPLIDRWVVETALGNIDRLHPDGSLLSTCAINLSGASLEDADLVERIAQLISLYQIVPQRLVFEITETVAMRDFAASSALISRLRSLGCRVALDDFGAGMSSFGYLKNLELDMVKIDGSFVQNLTSDRMSQSIVKAVTEIGHQQGLAVVAEWVSTSEIREILVAMNVDYAQGFALHRPERVLFQRDAHG